MNLDDLQAIKSKERQTDSLQPLSGSFYEEVGSYLAELREERADVAEELGFDDPAFRRLSDEIDTAEDTVESIYDRRVGKVVKAASIAAAGMPAENDGLTDAERALYETLVDEIADHRDRVLTDIGDGGGTDGPPESTTNYSTEGTASDSDPEESTPSEGAREATAGFSSERGSDDAGDRSESPESAPAEDADRANAVDDEPGRPEGEDSTNDGVPTSDGGEPTGAPSPADDVARATVHITRDVGEILGVDERAYELSRGDVVTLPEDNAAPLLERDAAERLE